MLAGRLGARFASARVVKRPRLLPSLGLIEVQVGQVPKFSVMLRRSRYGNDEWILKIGPWRFWGLLKFVLGHNLTGFSPERMQLCREIHAMLTSTPGITAVRWYFEGVRSQSAAVATPDELPWGPA
jgi:hypothetical protein